MNSGCKISISHVASNRCDIKGGATSVLTRYGKAEPSFQRQGKDTTVVFFKTRARQGFRLSQKSLITPNRCDKDMGEQLVNGINKF